ncbi:MAG: hypothetical protein HY271_03195 [Deltaproteobacteria bacterium]|nr:hypothetical protein [Deltaproteobacteria bacterium]
MTPNGRNRLVVGAVGTAVVLAGVLAVAARIERVRDAVREPITMTVAALLVTPWQAHAAWSPGRPIPATMLEPAAAVVDGKLYVFGGFVTTARAWEFPATTRVNVYDPVADTWSRAADMPAPVTHVNAVVVGHEVWLAGGFEGDEPGRAVASVHRYDAVNDRWSDGPPLPEPVAGGTLALVEDAARVPRRALHYLGGFAPDRDTTLAVHWALAFEDAAGEASDRAGANVASATETMTVAGSRWEPRAPLPAARGHLASAVVADRLYAIGGQRRHDTNPIDLAAVDAYDARTDTWTAVASLPTPRSHFEAATFVREGRIYVVGGRNNTTSLFIKGAGLADILVYDPAAERWTELPGLPVGIESAVARPLADRLVVTAGASFGDIVPQRGTFVGALP